MSDLVKAWKEIFEAVESDPILVEHFDADAIAQHIIELEMADGH